MRLTLGIQKMNSAICKPLATPAFMSQASIGALAAILILVASLLAPNPLAAQRPERPTLEITGYVIDAEIDTTTHHLAAKTTVTFNAPDNSEMVSFGFHPALKVNKITDASGKVLTGERSADGTIRITPASPPVSSQPTHWTFEYEGILTGNEDGPVEGLKLAAIQEPITYLLYAARWFPTTGYLTNRFTAEIHIRVPQGHEGLRRAAAQGASRSSQARRRQARRPIRFQLDQTRLPRHHYRRPLRRPRVSGRGQS